jgi:hypothetical protein
MTLVIGFLILELFESYLTMVMVLGKYSPAVEEEKSQINFRL